MKLDFAIRYVEVLASGDMLKLGAKPMEEIKMGRVAVCRGTAFTGLLLIFERDGRTLKKLRDAQGFRLPLGDDGCVDVERNHTLILNKVHACFRTVPDSSGAIDSFETDWVPTVGQVVKACQLYGLYEGAVLSPADAASPLK